MLLRDYFLKMLKTKMLHGKIKNKRENLRNNEFWQNQFCFVIQKGEIVQIRNIHRILITVTRRDLIIEFFLAI